MWRELALLRVQESPGGELDRDSWPGILEPVRALLAGVDFTEATVLVGENGAGKSTLVEGIATAWGFPADGGSTWEQRQTRDDVPLADALQVQRGAGAARSGFFLRAETVHALTVYLDDLGAPRGRQLLSRSHGESFLDMLLAASRNPGLWILDEPESALSFQGQLALIGLLKDRTAAGNQVIMSTHSPLLARLPGARILEVGEWGLRETDWEELEIVAHWRAFLDAPERYLRHL